MTSQSKPLRVLIVDDDAMSRELLAVLLEGEGYAVECAESGETALALLHRGDRAPDLVLVDAQMPGLTGTRLAGKLRRACASTTLLLAMSGSRPPEEALSRFDGFLLKPFKMKEVAAALSSSSPRECADAMKRPTKRERWGVVTGPAGRSSSRPKLISIQASASPSASNGSMHTRSQSQSQRQSAEPAEAILSDRSGEALVEVPVLDETIYRQLAAAMPAPQLRQMYALCMDDTRERIAEMRRLVAEHAPALFARQAHAIQGGCGMLGATELQRMAAELEANGLETTAADGAHEVNSLDKLTAACDRLECILGSRV
jgi:CheY-like chemotaxis protein